MCVNRLRSLIESVYTIYSFIVHTNHALDTKDINSALRTLSPKIVGIKLHQTIFKNCYCKPIDKVGI